MRYLKINFAERLIYIKHDYDIAKTLGIKNDDKVMKFLDIISFNILEEVNEGEIIKALEIVNMDINKLFPYKF